MSTKKNPKKSPSKSTLGDFLIIKKTSRRVGKPTARNGGRTSLSPELEQEKSHQDFKYQSNATIQFSFQFEHSTSNPGENGRDENNNSSKEDDQRASIDSSANKSPSKRSHLTSVQRLKLQYILNKSFDIESRHADVCLYCQPIHLLRKIVFALKKDKIHVLSDGIHLTGLAPSWILLSQSSFSLSNNNSSSTPPQSPRKPETPTKSPSNRSPKTGHTTPVSSPSNTIQNSNGSPSSSYSNGFTPFEESAPKFLQFSIFVDKLEYVQDAVCKALMEIIEASCSRTFLLQDIPLKFLLESSLIDNQREKYLSLTLGKPHVCEINLRFIVKIHEPTLYPTDSFRLNLKSVFGKQMSTKSPTTSPDKTIDPPRSPDSKDFEDVQAESYPFPWELSVKILNEFVNQFETSDLCNVILDCLSKSSVPETFSNFLSEIQKWLPPKTKFLHEDRRLFTQIINFISQSINVLPHIVEKDYFTSHLLWCLQNSGWVLEMKGGTSLSKCWNMIKRVSEDVDIHIAGVEPDTSKENKQLFDELTELRETKKIKGKPFSAERQKFFQGLGKTFSSQLTGIKASIDREFTHPSYQNLDMYAVYPTCFPVENNETFQLLPPLIRLQIGLKTMSTLKDSYVQKCTPACLVWDFIEKHKCTSLFEQLGFIFNKPKEILCVVPALTLVQKITDGIVYRYPRIVDMKTNKAYMTPSQDTTDPPFDPRIVRHYEDVAALLGSSAFHSMYENFNWFAFYREVKKNNLIRTIPYKNITDLQEDPSFAYHEPLKLELLQKCQQQRASLYYISSQPVSIPSVLECSSKILDWLKSIPKIKKSPVPQPTVEENQIAAAPSEVPASLTPVVEPAQ